MAYGQFNDASAPFSAFPLPSLTSGMTDLPLATDNEHLALIDGSRTDQAELPIALRQIEENEESQASSPRQVAEPAERPYF